MKEYTFEDLVYDRKARTEFFLIQWCKKFGYLKTAMDHAFKRNEIREKLELLD